MTIVFHALWSIPTILLAVLCWVIVGKVRAWSYSRILGIDPILEAPKPIQAVAMTTGPFYFILIIGLVKQNLSWPAGITLIVIAAVLTPFVYVAALKRRVLMEADGARGDL